MPKPEKRPERQQRPPYQSIAKRAKLAKETLSPDSPAFMSTNAAETPPAAPAATLDTKPATPPPAPAGTQAAQISELAAPLAEAMPASPSTPPPAVDDPDTDARGRLFDPEKHRADASGNPMRDKNGFFYSKNLGAPPKPKPPEIRRATLPTLRSRPEQSSPRPARTPTTPRRISF